METKRPFARVAAELSLSLAFLAVVLFLGPLFAEQIKASMPVAFGLAVVTMLSLGVFVCLVGAVLFGVVALCGVRKHGREGILAPALTGSLLAAPMLILILYIMASGFAGASRSVQARDGSTNAPAAARPAR